MRFYIAGIQISGDNTLQRSMQARTQLIIGLLSRIYKDATEELGEDKTIIVVLPEYAIWPMAMTNQEKK